MLISVGICPRHKHFSKYVLWASPEIFTNFAYFFDALSLSVTAVWFIVASFYFIIKCCSSFRQLTLLFSLSYLLSWLPGALKCAQCPKAWTTAEPLGWPGCLAEAPRACCCMVSLVQVCLVEGYSFPLPSMYDCSSALSESYSQQLTLQLSAAQIDVTNWISLLPLPGAGLVQLSSEEPAHFRHVRSVAHFSSYQR